MAYQFLLRADGSTSMPYCSPGVREFYGVGPEGLQDSAMSIFERVHADFFNRFQQAIPDATEAEKRFAALSKLNLTGTEIAAMLGISPDSVVKTRYRLRKKVADGNLETLLQNI